MKDKKRQEVIGNMLKIKSAIGERLEKNEQEIDNIGYYRDFKFKNTELGIEDAYIVKLKYKEGKKKKQERDDQKERIVYEIYDEDSNLIALVDETGKVQFEPSYIESLKEIDENYFDTLGLENAEFELPEELGKDDLVLNGEELSIEENKKKLEEISKVVDSKNINSYSELQTDQTVAFEKITNKQELDPNVKVTQTETLADMIPEIKQKGIVKVGVVYSDAAKGQSGRFSFVGIDKNGQIQTIDSLENTQGTTTGQTVTSINSRDGSVVEEEQVAGMVRINGRNAMNGQEELLSVKVGQYGILEVDYVRAELSEDKETRYISAPIETKNIKSTTRNVREFMDKSKNTNMEDEIDRAKPELARDGETRMRNIDDTASNDMLTPDDIIVLEDGTKTTLRKEAEKDHVSPEDFTKRYNEGTGKTPDEIIDNIHDEYAEEYGAPTRDL